MNVITNKFEDAEVVSLDKSGSARGPFLVIQGGFAPEDKEKTDRLFILRRDGLWVASIHYLASDKPETLDEAVFGNNEEITALFGRLEAKPSVMKTEVSSEAIRTWQARTAGTDPMENLWKWAEGYRTRQKNQE